MVQYLTSLGWLHVHSKHFSLIAFAYEIFLGTLKRIFYSLFLLLYKTIRKQLEVLKTLCGTLPALQIECLLKPLGNSGCNSFVFILFSP